MPPGAKPTPATVWLREQLARDPLESNSEIAAAAVAAGHKEVDAKRVSNERYKVKAGLDVMRAKQRAYDRRSRAKRAKPAARKPKPKRPPVARHVDRHRVRLAAHDAKIEIRRLIVQLGAASIYDIVDELLAEAPHPKGNGK